MMQLKPVSLRPLAPPSCTRVVLVRHGRSTFNEQGRYQGSSNDSVLTQKGWQTAVQTGKALQNMRFDAVYSSPLQRVQDTIAAIRQGMSCSFPDKAIDPLPEVPIYTDSALREIDIPAWQGLPFAEVRQRFAIDYQCWKQQPHRFRMPHSELDSDFFPVLELYDRANQFWQRILPRHHGQTLLIVAHGGTNHALLSTAIGLAPQHHHTLQQSNCGISILEFPERQHPRLRSLNATHHLNETLPKLKEGKRGLRLLLLPLDSNADTPGAAIHRLAHQLQPAAIDLSVCATFPQAKQAIDLILDQHSSTLRFETFRSNFLQSWQQTIADRTADSDQLITALAVTDIRQIQQFIASVIGLSSDRSSAIHLEPGQLSSLHYPSMSHSPILQSLNFNSPVSSFQEVFA